MPRKKQITDIAPVEVKEIQNETDYSVFDLVIEKRVEHIYNELKEVVADIFGVQSRSSYGSYDITENKKADTIAILLLRRTIEKIERESLNLF